MRDSQIGSSSDILLDIFSILKCRPRLFHFFCSFPLSMEHLMVATRKNGALIDATGSLYPIDEWMDVDESSSQTNEMVIHLHS